MSQRDGAVSLDVVHSRKGGQWSRDQFKFWCTSGVKKTRLKGLMAEPLMWPSDGQLLLVHHLHLQLHQSRSTRVTYLGNEVFCLVLCSGVPDSFYVILIQMNLLHTECSLCHYQDFLKY